MEDERKTYLIDYSLMLPDGTLKHFQEYWKTRLVPTATVVSGNWAFAYQDVHVLDLKMLDTVDNPNIKYTVVSQY